MNPFQKPPGALSKKDMQMMRGAVPIGGAMPPGAAPSEDAIKKDIDFKVNMQHYAERQQAELLDRMRNEACSTTVCKLLLSGTWTSFFSTMSVKLWYGGTYQAMVNPDYLFVCDGVVEILREAGGTPSRYRIKDSLLPFFSVIFSYKCDQVPDWWVDRDKLPSVEVLEK
jgi:hypothetical protein